MDGTAALSDLRHFFAWLEPDGSVRMLDPANGKPRGRSVGTWSATCIQNRWQIVVSRPGIAWTALIDWAPCGGRGMAILFREDPAIFPA